MTTETPIVVLKPRDSSLSDFDCSGDCGRFGRSVPGWKLGSSWDWVPCPVHGLDGES